MTADQWQQVRDLFEAALDRETDTIASWVNSQTPDTRVRAEVLSLLEHHSRAGSFLAEPVGAHAPDLLSDEDALAPGTPIGPYTIVRQLGQGGMGRVYLASDARLGRNVALKALAPQLTRDPSHRERLRREARAAAALTHPGICTVYALEELGDELYIATEFVDGHTLREEIASGRQPTGDQIIDTARALTSALASAHAKGITHRDLKPENVMRTADGRLKILDFGLARLDTPSNASAPPVRALATLPGILLGTPAYMAPEQLNGQPADARTDVFAFGVLMYEYSCGVHPFDAATELARLARVLESDARPLEDRCPYLPAAIADVVARCLRKAPAERYGSGGEILDVINRNVAAQQSRPSMIWWRTHQLVIICLYVIAATIAWHIKEAFAGAISLWAFIAIGIGAALGGIVRGHLLFTQYMNRPRLVVEWRRTKRANTIVDLAMAAVLVADAFHAVPTRPLWALLTMALAVGIALAAVLMEPATTAAAFGVKEDVD
jgi:serine/threonine protein kinase